MTQRTQNPMRAAFHQVTLMLLELFEVHKAPPALIEQVADELKVIINTNMPGHQPSQELRGKLKMERLLDQLEFEELASGWPGSLSIAQEVTHG